MTDLPFVDWLVRLSMVPSKPLRILSGVFSISPASMIRQRFDGYCCELDMCLFQENFNMNIQLYTNYIQIYNLLSF